MFLWDQPVINISILYFLYDSEFDFNPKIFLWWEIKINKLFHVYKIYKCHIIITIRIISMNQKEINWKFSFLLIWIYNILLCSLDTDKPGVIAFMLLVWCICKLYVWSYIITNYNLENLLKKLNIYIYFMPSYIHNIHFLKYLFKSDQDICCFFRNIIFIY